MHALPLLAALALGQAMTGRQTITDLSTLKAKATGSSTARTLAARFADTVNVKDFGAVGDGTTDDTAAIQAAISSVTVTAWSGSAAGQYVKGGGTVFIPSGVYRITSTIKIGQHVRVVGASTLGFNHPGYTQTITDLTKQKASIIYADFSSPNAWAFDSANYTTATGAAISYKAYTTGANVDDGTISATHGIQVQDIFFRSASTPVYGAVRLQGSADSRIVGCGYYGFRIGFAVYSSWGWAIRDSWGLSYWYGVVAGFDVNAFTIDGYFNRLTTPAPLTPGSTDVNAVYQDYSDTDLSADYKLSTTGVYLQYANSFDAVLTCEHWDVGAQLFHASGSARQLYLEDNAVPLVTVASTLEVPHVYNFNSTPRAIIDAGAGSKVRVGSVSGNSTATFLRTSIYSTATVDGLEKYAAGSYSPTFAASGGGAIGNGTLAGTYSRLGDFIVADVTMTAGSSTNFGTGPFEFSLPVSTVSPGGGAGSAIRQGVSEDAVMVRIDAGTGKARLFAASSSAAVVQGAPRTYASTDVFHFTVTYHVQ